MKKERKEHLANFSIAGFTYYDSVDCFKQLQIGTTLTLAIDKGNKYDERAIVICYKKFKLGYVPRSENRIIYKLLKIGLNCMIAKVQVVSANEHPENQVRVVVHLINGNEIE